MSSHVLHLIACDYVGGPAKQILFHAEDMQNSAYRVEIGSFQDIAERPEILTEAEHKGIPTICLKGGLRLDVVSELARALERRKDVLLCTHGFKANVVGYFATRRTGTRHVAFVRGWTAETWRVALYEVLERQVLARAQWVVCVSGKQAERVRSLRAGKKPPFVVPNAMLPPYRRPVDGPPVSRHHLGIPEDAFVFGSSGRLSAEKGHKYLISAFSKLNELVRGEVPIFLLVVGDGREQSALEKQAAELGIRDKVLFAGYQGNCSDWMDLFDCMVQPSLTEGTPNSVLEALCMEIPVVATGVGGVPDLITDGVNGLLVPSRDTDAMARAMERMLRSPDLRKTLIEGVAAVNDAYSTARQREKLIAVYEAAFATPEIGGVEREEPTALHAQ